MPSLPLFIFLGPSKKTLHQQSLLHLTDAKEQQCQDNQTEISNLGAALGGIKDKTRIILSSVWPQKGPHKKIPACPSLRASPKHSWSSGSLRAVTIP